MRLRLAIVLLALTTPALAQPSVDFQCPRAGTVSEFSNGSRNEALGADPADATRCGSRLTSGSGAVSESWVIYGFWNANNQGSELAAQRAGMAQLYPATAGKTAAFIWRSTGGASGTPFQDTWRVIGFEPVTVRAGTFNAMLLERVSEGQGSNQFRGTWRRWVDLNSRVTVKQSYVHTRGTPPAGADWEVTTVTLPAPPPPSPAPAAPPRQQRPPARG